MQIICKQENGAHLLELTSRIIVRIALNQEHRGEGRLSEPRANRYPTLVRYFGTEWLNDEDNFSHVLWIRWNHGDRLGFLDRWERTLSRLDSAGSMRPRVVHMLRNPDQFLDTVAELEIATVLMRKGFNIELEARKSGKTTDIFLTQEQVCIEVKNLHLDPMLVDQTLSGEAEPVWLRDRLPSAVEEKYEQLPSGYANILVVVAPADVQFDEFEDFFINVPTTVDTTTMQVTHGRPQGFFYSERTDGSMIHTKVSAVIMWKDYVRRYIINPSAYVRVSEDVLARIVC